MRSWAAGVLTKNKDLATNGPYAVTRNPLYLGSFLMMIGFSTLLGAVHGFVVMFLLMVVLYRPKIRSEETYLQQKFGSRWDDYAARTPRLLPRHVSLRAMRCAWSVGQWRRNKENVTVSGVIIGLAVFQAWSSLGK
jgi:protein-S-isoprenylcysteine O-methyltransferase Ste14